MRNAVSTASFTCGKPHRSTGTPSVLHTRPDSRFASHSVSSNVPGACHVHMPTNASGNCAALLAWRPQTASEASLLNQEAAPLRLQQRHSELDFVMAMSSSGRTPATQNCSSINSDRLCFTLNVPAPPLLPLHARLPARWRRPPRSSIIFARRTGGTFILRIEDTDFWAFQEIWSRHPRRDALDRAQLG